PFIEPPAPGFFRKPGEANSPVASRREQGGGGMKEQVVRLHPLLERSLDRKSGFWSGVVAGGKFAMLAGGTGGRAVDYRTKRYLASVEPESGLVSGRLQGLAGWWQKHHGLTGNEELLAPLFKEDAETGVEIGKRVPLIDTAIKTMEAKAEESRLTKVS